MNNDEMKDKVDGVFESFKDKEYNEEDVQTVLDNEEQIKNKCKKGPLKDFFEYIVLFIQMIKAYFKKEYTDVPVQTIVVVVATLLYVLSPIDLIPDFIPVIGLLDDALILTLCLKCVKDEIDKYKEFRDSTIIIDK